MDRPHGQPVAHLPAPFGRRNSVFARLRGRVKADLLTRLSDATSDDPDAAFDGNAVVADLDGRGAKAVIARHPRRIPPRAIGTGRHGRRQPVEGFCKLVEFERSALRADKTDQGFEAMIRLGAAIINPR